MEEASKRDVLQYRALLFSIAYNMLGSIMDAEDMVQDTFTHWYNSDQAHVENPKYYLIRAITNRCINGLREAQRARESYVGTWLPEPLVCKQKIEKEMAEVENRDELSIGFLYLLEKLNPLERAVLILRESFDFPYPEIAQTFDMSEDNCRQLLSRAKAKLKQEKNRFNINKERHNEILRRFLEACGSGTTEQLVSLLKEDVTLYSDGGGKVTAALNPLSGREKVLKFISGILKQAGHVSSVEIANVNGLSGAIVYIDTSQPVPDLLIALDADENDKIQHLYFIRNPEKLQHLSKNQG